MCVKPFGNRLVPTARETFARREQPMAKGATLQEAAARDCGFAKKTGSGPPVRAGGGSNEERRMSEFGRLVALEIPALRRYSRKLTRDPVEAEDLLQNCLVRALAKQALWQPGTDLRRWLFTLLYHQQVNALRRQARERRNLGEAARALAGPAACDPSGRVLVKEMAQAIAVLPQEQREAMRRVAFGGMGYDEAATALAVPQGTLRSRLARARIVLRKLLDENAAAAVPPPRSARGAGTGGDRLAA
jgi:RNA polymerase sigma-70 factor (ECF subfamily)